MERTTSGLSQTEASTISTAVQAEKERQEGAIARPIQLGICRLPAAAVSTNPQVWIPGSRGLSQMHRTIGRIRDDGENGTIGADPAAQKTKERTENPRIALQLVSDAGELLRVISVYKTLAALGCSGENQKMLLLPRVGPCRKGTGMG
jgi:hypothetical protein